MRQLWFVVGLVGCATATPGNEPPDAPVGGPDAPRIDAPGVVIDAPVQCTTMTSNLLTNPAFEMTTTGWMETLIDAQAIVRADGPVAAHTPTLKAWMGGVVGGLITPATDALWQDVVIPASTTQLVVTGMYDVRTLEATTTSVFDTGTLALVTTANAPIESVLALSNLTPRTAWTAINHPVTAAVAGMTIRLRMTSSNDLSSTSSFYFDSLGLMATFCGP